MPNPATSRSTNSSSSAIANSGLVVRSRPTVVVRCDAPGAEQNDPGAVGRVDGEVVGEVVEAAQRLEHLMGQRFGLVGTAQVGAPDRADHQRTPGEQRHRAAVAPEEVGVVVRACGPVSPSPRTVDRVGQRELVAVTDRAVRRREPGRRRGDEHRARAVGQGGAAGHVVGMRVGVERPRQSQPEPVGQLSWAVGKRGGSITAAVPSPRSIR